MASVICIGCRRTWPVMTGGTVYERENLESRPCPHCAGHTLTYAEPKVDRAPRRLHLSFQRRSKAARLVGASRPAA